MTPLPKPLMEDQSERSEAPAPTTTLERRASVAGNVLLVDAEDGKRKAYLLQRKIKSKVFGTVRVGYLLKDPAGKEDEGGMWEVAESATGAYPHEMVAVFIEEKSRVLGDEMERPGGAASAAANTSRDPKTELSAMQMVAAHDPEGTGHVMGTSLVAADQLYVYIITPYHKEGTLNEYRIAAGGTLSEDDARFFFRQILKVRNRKRISELSAALRLRFHSSAAYLYAGTHPFSSEPFIFQTGSRNAPES